MKKEYLDVGRVLATFGIKGAVKVEPWMNTPEDLAHLNKLYLDHGAKELEVKSATVYKGIVRVQFSGIDDIDQAAFLRGQTLYMKREDFKLKKGSYFLQDLIGLTVKNVDTGKLYGKLEDILETMGANRVYTIRTSGNKELLIPAIPDVVIETNLEEGYMNIRPLAGLFEDEEDILEEIDSLEEN